MAMVLVAFMSIIGCVIIGFVFGWKLTLLTVFVSLPIMMGQFKPPISADGMLKQDIQVVPSSDCGSRSNLRG